MRLQFKNREKYAGVTSLFIQEKLYAVSRDGFCVPDEQGAAIIAELALSGIEMVAVVEPVVTEAVPVMVVEQPVVEQSAAEGVTTSESAPTDGAAVESDTPTEGRARRGRRG